MNSEDTAYFKEILRNTPDLEEAWALLRAERDHREAEVARSKVKDLKADRKKYAAFRKRAAALNKQIEVLKGEHEIRQSIPVRFTVDLAFDPEAIENFEVSVEGRVEGAPRTEAQMRRHDLLNEKLDEWLNGACSEVLDLFPELSAKVEAANLAYGKLSAELEEYGLTVEDLLEEESK